MKKRFVLATLTAATAAVLFSTSEFIIEGQMLEKVEKEYGFFAKNRALALVGMMNKAQGRDEHEKLEAVNDFFNKTPYGLDKDVWGVSDYWATRLEFIGKDKGDCEDYVIAKYFTLLELGIDPKKLFMGYVKYVPLNIAHMVLLYYETPRSEPLVLDNYNRKIFPASTRKDLIPVYSFSGSSLLDAKNVQLGKLLPASTRQKRAWDELKIIKKDQP
ncbi:transglutaminase-like cysteine peptidase [Sulfurospirillum sp. T05]|uniref:Transglutaminase-like cysteine peptidase n=1 Tax=Sulfurospirillum tamanense TaxID=2813362 RepID=A0ABS2WTY3_9BACT|nr:transglutaminase-like cysteine peptidase [Sulfurospirillum tamanensis]MBN2965127.1 transglutaminase-like cysteine peptidase [Sulfurospirillum tamanensis]